MWTLVLLTTALAQTPDAAARDLSITVELTGGRQLGASGFLDYGLVPDVLYLNGGYSLLKSPALAPTATAPAFATAPTHVLFAGADWSIGRHFTLSGLFSGSPRVSDTVVLNPSALPALRVSVTNFRSSFGGALTAAWNSAGLSKVEWVLDAGGSVTANRLGHEVRVGAKAGPEHEDALISARAMAGLTLTFADDTDVSVRGGLTAYSSDPLTAGKFDADQRLAIQRVTPANRFATDVEEVSRAAEQASTQLGRVDSLSGYASAPIWVESRISVTQRLGRRWSCQAGWTFNRYVPTAGHANIVFTKVTVKLPGGWRLWLGGAVQLDEPLDQPSQRTASDPQPTTSALGTLGAEYTL